MFASEPLVIQGFLVLIALGSGSLTSLIGYAINRALKASTNKETIAQANLRADLQHVRQATEEVAIEGSDPYFQQRLDKRVDEVSLKTTYRLSIQTKTGAFNVFNSILQSIIPLCSAAPLYFTNLITLDTFFGGDSNQLIVII
jgi:putative ATP-binding cassette transporter